MQPTHRAEKAAFSVSIVVPILHCNTGRRAPRCWEAFRHVSPSSCACGLVQHRRWVENRLARRSVGAAASSHRQQRARGSADNLLDRPCSTRKMFLSQLTVQMTGKRTRTCLRGHVPRTAGWAPRPPGHSDKKSSMAFVLGS